MRQPHPMFMSTFNHMYALGDNFAEPLWNYFAYGLQPGSCVLAILEDDYKRAISHAHSMLNTQIFKYSIIWLDNFAPSRSYGSQHNVNQWISKSDEERRDIMIECGLRPSVVDILKGTHEP